MAKIFFTNGAEIEVDLAPKFKAGEILPILQGLLGGYIQIATAVDTDAGTVLVIVNEDGLALGLDQNARFPQYVGTVVTVIDGVEID